MRLTPALLPLVWLAGCAPGPSDEMVLYAGTVEAAGFRASPAGAAADRAGEPVARVGLDPAGSFLLAVPTGSPVRLLLLDASGSPLGAIAHGAGAESEFPACDQGLVELGVVRSDPRCARTTECLEAYDRLLICERDAEDLCFTCPRPGDCAAERQAWEGCRSGAGCDDEREALRACYREHACQRRSGECEASCDGARSTRDTACARCREDSPVASCALVPPGCP